MATFLGLLVFCSLVIVLGGLVAHMAEAKGMESPGEWWVYGSLLFAVALPHVMLAPPGPRVRQCPFCAERMRSFATVCPHCGRESNAATAPPGPLVAAGRHTPVEAQQARPAGAPASAPPQSPPPTDLTLDDDPSAPDVLNELRHLLRSRAGGRAVAKFMEQARKDGRLTPETYQQARALNDLAYKQGLL